MSPAWESFKTLLKAGVIFRDGDYRFPDTPTEVNPKYFLILSDEIENTFFVCCLTTSKINTYRNSSVSHVKIADPDSPEGAIIIEVEKIELVLSKKLESLFIDSKIEISNKILSPDELREVYDEIEEDKRKTIPADFKEYLGLS